jgi:hypothetical protein
VQFVDDGSPAGTPVLLTSGSASIALPSLMAGSRSITATFTSTVPSIAGSTTANPLPQTVAPAPLTITANNQTMVAGTALPALTVHYAGFVNGDTAASLSSPPVVSTTATASSPAGSYTITVHGAVDPNYTITFVPGTLTITPATSTPPPPPPALVVTAQLVTMKVRKKKQLVVEVFENGVLTNHFTSPYQMPAFKNIQVRVQGSNVVLTARKGKKTVTTTFAG